MSEGFCVTFLGHSGFYLETPEADLLFDYYTGTLPDPNPDRPLYVFVSHRHADHFSKEIFRYGGRAFYFLSDDIPMTDLPEELRPRAVRVSPGEVNPGIPGQVSELLVRTYPSTDEGVAFLLDIGSLRIYHAGDLNRWHWEEENEEDRIFNEAQRRDYAAALSRIASDVKRDGHVPDVAFVPLDNRLGEPGCYYGAEEFMETVGAARLFPMHLFGDPGIIERLKQRPGAAAYRDRIYGTGTPGERLPFKYRKD